MNHDDVIRLAREAADPDAVDPLCGSDQRDLITLDLDEMVRFAALVAAHEREACAKVAAWILKMPENDVSSAIRERGMK